MKDGIPEHVEEEDTRVWVSGRRCECGWGLMTDGSILYCRRCRHHREAKHTIRVRR